MRSRTDYVSNLNLTSMLLSCRTVTGKYNHCQSATMNYDFVLLLPQNGGASLCRSPTVTEDTLVQNFNAITAKCIFYCSIVQLIEYHEGNLLVQQTKNTVTPESTGLHDCRN
jgi:hypothetical protein